jgi:DEAD/DEAH box helicase domain-containing protein
MLKLPKEEAVIDLTNRYIGTAHLLSTAYELPIKKSELTNYFGEEFDHILQNAVSRGLLIFKKDLIFPRPGIKRPHETISLRSASSHTYQIVEMASGEIIGYLEEPLVFIYLHPGAVYMHEMQTYIVRDLDIEGRKAFVEPSDEMDYYTAALEDTQIEILKSERYKKHVEFDVLFGELKVVNTVFGFNKKHVLTEELLGFESLNLPPLEFETKGFWIELNEDIIENSGISLNELAGGIHAIEHAHIGLLPLYAGCDRWDIGGVSTPKFFETGKTTIFIYDGYEGGIGFSEKGFERFEEHIHQTLKLIENCECIAGCPSCIVSPKCGNNNEPLDKKAAEEILESHLLVK